METLKEEAAFGGTSKNYMTKKEFKELTGEDPEDVLGGDWKNEIEDTCECGGELVKISAGDESAQKCKDCGRINSVLIDYSKKLNQKYD